MSDPRVDVEVDGGRVPRDALFAAACAFTDRAFVRLDRTPDKPDHVTIALRPKPGRAFDAKSLTEEVEAEVAAQAFRRRLVEEGRDFTASVEGRGGPSIDDLLTAPEVPT